jgi:hypothetical protein
VCHLEQRRVDEACERLAGRIEPKVSLGDVVDKALPQPLRGGNHQKIGPCRQPAEPICARGMEREVAQGLRGGCEDSRIQGSRR